jgi:hypothetical protein
MKKYTFSWFDNYLTGDISSIDDVIAHYERYIEQFLSWKQKGIILDQKFKNHDGVLTFSTTNPEIATAEGFIEALDSSEEYESLENIYAGEEVAEHIHYKLEDGYKRYLYKVGIVMKSRSTMKKFSQVINAIGFSSGYDYSKEIGASLGISSYKVGKKKVTFQLWTLRNETQFHAKYPMLLNGCSALLYFYPATAQLDESRLHLIESAKEDSTPIIFIGYGENLSVTPETSDPNAKLLSADYPQNHKLYISLDNPPSMIKVLDKISRLILNVEKKGY